MASDKRNPRNDTKSGSSYCSSATFVLFVALCLVGVWMMTSATVVPVEFNVVSTVKSDNKDEKVSISNANPSEGNLSNEPEKFDWKPIEKKQENKEKEFMDSNWNNGNGETIKESSKEKDQNEKEHSPERSEDRTFVQKINSENIEKYENQEKDQTEKENSPEGSEEKTFVEKINSENIDKYENQEKDQTEKENLPNISQDELLNETSTSPSTTWSTQSAESKTENEIQNSNSKTKFNFSWKLCNVTAGPDYIPCLDNEKAIKKLRSTKHYEHRERHCPDVGPTCLVPLPIGYKTPIRWPISRDKIWYDNIPHTKLVSYKGHQNWIKVSGEHLTFPGGGTQFKHGVSHYIDFIQQSFNEIAWGKRTRVILDVGCGVASFGGYLFERDVQTMSFAPKDEHEAQVQFALERGIPAISAVMGTKRLPFPGTVFDAVHCARCRVPWHIEGGKLLLELNRVLRPGGYFIWSATPVYQKLPEDIEIWKLMTKLTNAMCWKMVMKTKDKVNGVGVAIFQKPTDNICYESRSQSDPAICQQSDDPDASWNVPLQTCMHKVKVESTERGSRWPQEWPQRQVAPPYWLKDSQIGVYGKPASEDFKSDYEHWKRVVSNSYLKGLGIDWSTVRNVMDMRAVYGGFAAALKEMQVWVMNIVTIDSPDTLPIIYERGYFGLYHDWCESFSTYPRSYDLLHADHLFSKLKSRCGLVGVIAEVDRILRPEGKLIVRDRAEMISELEEILKSLHYEVRMIYTKDTEGLLCVQKTAWRPTDYEAII